MNTITANTNTYTIGATKIAEALAAIPSADKVKIRKAADRMSRITRQEALASLGIKVVTPVTANASKKFTETEEVRKDFENAVKAAKAAARAEQEKLDAAWALVDEATASPNKGFNSFAAALAKAKESR